MSKNKKKIKIAHRLLAAFFLVSFLTVGGLGILIYSELKDAMLKRTEGQINSINILKKDHIVEYLKRRNSHHKLFFDSLASGHGSIEERLRANHDSVVYVAFKIGDSTNIYCHSEDVDLRINKKVYNMRAGMHDFSDYSRNGELLTGYVYQKDSTYVCLIERPDKIFDILNEWSGMGETGESYLVGFDKRMRTGSRLLKRANPMSIIVDSEGVNECLTGRIGSGIYFDYRGEEVLSTVRSIRLNGLELMILTELDYNEAMLPVLQIRNKILTIGVFVLLGVIFLSWMIAKKIAKPIHRFKNIIDRLATGAVSAVEIEGSQLKEIADMEVSLYKLSQARMRMVAFARETGKGNFEIPFEILGKQDILGWAMLQMRGRLKEFKNRTEEFSKSSSLAIVKVEEDERERISHALRDDVTPMLELVKDIVRELDQDHDKVKHLTELIDKTEDELNNISQNLMPSFLIEEGIIHALEYLTDRIRKLSHLTPTFTHELVESNLSKYVSISLYRIIQEAVNNTVKHADATTIDINIFEADKEVHLNVKDNGKGFDYLDFKRKKAITNGFVNLEQRVKLHEGCLEVISTAEHGTEINVTIPL